MKIWRMGNTKPIKDEPKKKNDEFTDINKASTPKADKYPKDKMEEIYSTKDKQIKYKRLTPLEAEEAAKRREEAKEKLASGEAEISLNAPQEEEKIVELTSEYEEGTVIAEDIIEDVEQFKAKKERNVKLQDIDEIDINIDPRDAIKKYERQVNSTQRHDERVKPKTPSVSAYEQIFGKPKFYVGKEKVVAKIPTYQHESKINAIHLKAGRFSEVVESEYDEYLKSNSPVTSKKGVSSGTETSNKPSFLSAFTQRASQSGEQKKASDGQKKKPLKKAKKFFKIIYRMVFPKKPTDAENISKSTKAQSTPKTIEYQSRQDSSFVTSEISSNLKKHILKALVLTALFILSLTLTIMEASVGTKMLGNTPYTPLIYCGINLVTLILVGVTCKSFIINGLKPLRHFKGNSDTAVSCAFIAGLIQQLVSMFMPGAFVASDYHLYTTIVTLGFMMNCIGRAIMAYRVKANFRFITAKSPSHVAKIFNDEETARKMLSGTTASRSVVAYQHKTDFLSDFLKISYAPDPSEEITGKLAPITIISSFFVAIVYGILSKSVIGGLCALAVMCCISIPVCSLLTGNIPLLLACRDSLKNNAMISGYPSIKQFSDCDAIMVNASDLYPKGSIKVNKIDYFAQYRIDESMLCAAVVMKEAKSPLYRAFSDILKKNKDHLPKVESVIYEDKLGLVGWINGERVLIGNRKLLDRFHIYFEDAADETKYKNSSKEVTYIACSGQLVAMVVSTYKPDEKVKYELKRAQNNGLCIIVSSSDSNITAEKIALDYEIYSRAVKVLNTGYANMCNEICSKKEESSRSYLVTKGRFTSLMHAVTNAVSFRQNLTLGLIIEIFGLILGVLLCATMVLYASVSILGVLEILLYILFWSIAAIVAQLVKRP